MFNVLFSASQETRAKPWRKTNDHGREPGTIQKYFIKFTQSLTTKNKSLTQYGYYCHFALALKSVKPSLRLSLAICHSLQRMANDKWQMANAERCQ
jgi:hypothetical protein